MNGFVTPVSKACKYEPPEAARTTSVPRSVSHCGQRCARRGTLLVELLVCTILLSVVATILVPGIHSVYKQRKLTQCELLTLFELNNVATLIHGDVDADDIQLTAAYRSRYPSASCKIEQLNTTKDGDAAMRITISYAAGNTDVRSEKSLTVWKAQTEGSP